MSRDEAPELVPIGRAARIVGVHVDTLRRWEREGRVKSTRTAAGHRRFDVADLRRLSAPARNV